MAGTQFIVDRKESGQTLAAVLRKRYHISWAQAKRLIEGRHVRINNQVEPDVARRLKPGKSVSISPGAIDLKSGNRSRKPTPPAPAPKVKPKAAETPAEPKTRGPALDPDVLVYVDDAIVVVNKPAGLTTMRHAEEAAEFGEHGQKFLTRTLAGLLPAMLGTPNRPVYAVHRLDRDTSGLVVFARTKDAETNLTQQFRKHSIDRRYVALTRGTPPAGRLDSILVRNRGDDRRGSSRKSNPKDGKRAITQVRVIESLGEFSLVECKLETGRTHQVRIHLGEAGAPLCGETVYDRAINRKPLPDTSGANRPMLHATRLGLRHPETGETMTWDAAPPRDFTELLKKLKGA